MKAYFDTSFLVALYVPNDHTPAALRHRSHHEQLTISFNPLHRLELRTTVRQCAYGGLISEANARRILRHIEEDLDDGTLVHHALEWTDSLRTAETVAARRGLKMSCRSLDLWHVAAALADRSEGFVTFDKDQFELARAEGLRAVMPQ